MFYLQMLEMQKLIMMFIMILLYFGIRLQAETNKQQYNFQRGFIFFDFLCKTHKACQFQYKRMIEGMNNVIRFYPFYLILTVQQKIRLVSSSIRDIQVLDANQIDAIIQIKRTAELKNYLEGELKCLGMNQLSYLYIKEKEEEEKRKIQSQFQIYINICICK
ncbi:transmembrane protein, putative (macronuclear) [Tetrahymena thermophila SB210]|uniref:Transmembrane protein, putative n=1 Tax=Tetrahymena thermophila (strain SB210) TaxID=312017 RepID=W7XL52_TETTS|nr:transmembrane protein, putative [Tetrahymena thermophila SB210]EWS75684.1 transmembrane protein, putative [Tetrahymena thermophila SB210]|eukprot:XP_012651757.1 transmembrane protein, putative [Tetrahymena thermophila SB210]